MINTIGNLLLFVALIFATLQTIMPFCGLKRKHPLLIASARSCQLGQVCCVMLAYFLLTYAFWVNDFSIAYVAANSHPSLPLMYRLTAVWGAHEGSILFWILVLNLWGTMYAQLESSQSTTHAYPIVLATLGLMNVLFLSFLLFTSNPFLPNLNNLSGRDLNPLLQDPGFVIHPPMLYLGYVGFSVTFALGSAALLTGNLSQALLHAMRRYALIAWSFLTLGIALGSWWAYRVLGWGGFWFWDPVENASLLPWLSGTAFIHLIVLTEKRDHLKAWTLLLALITFALSVMGTFLVRSGILVSTHTFANDPTRGVYLLCLLAILLSMALIVYTSRISNIRSTPGEFNWLSRDMGLVLNSIWLIIAMLIILLGTLYPLIIDALQLGSVVVGAPYFNKILSPLLLTGMFAMGLYPLATWKQQNIAPLLVRSTKNLTLSLLAGIGVTYGLTSHLPLLATACVSLSIWVLLGVIGAVRIKPAMVCAHGGFAIFTLGLMLSSLLNLEKEVRIHPGTAVKLGPYQFFFTNTHSVSGPNFRGIRANFDVYKQTRHITQLQPEKRIYTVRDMVMTKIDIHPSIFRDLYIALGEPLDKNDWSVRLYYKPFIRWIWFGAILMLVGGFISIRRKA